VIATGAIAIAGKTVLDKTASATAKTAPNVTNKAFRVADAMRLVRRVSGNVNVNTVLNKLQKK